MYWCIRVRESWCVYVGWQGCMASWDRSVGHLQSSVTRAVAWVQNPGACSVVDEIQTGRGGHGHSPMQAMRYDDRLAIRAISGP